MGAERGVYEARDGNVCNDMGNMGACGVGQDLTQAWIFCVAHEEHTRRTPLGPLHPKTLKPWNTQA